MPPAPLEIARRGRGTTMLAAVARALEVRASLGVDGVATRPHLEEVARRAHLEVWERTLGGLVHGLYADGVIVLGRHLLTGTKCLVLAHELGHALLGHRSGAYVGAGGGRPRSRAEAAAPVFAFALLLGPPADTLDGLTEQIHVGDRAGPPAPALFAAVSVLAHVSAPRAESGLRPLTGYGSLAAL